MKILGLDPSINGSGLTEMYIDDSFEITSFYMTGFTKTNKWILENEFFRILKLPDNYDTHPYHYRAKIMLNIFSDMIKDVEYLAIEDYALGATGNVFDIAEFIGVIKNHFYEDLKIPIKKLPPNSVKEFATGSGGADKMVMWAGFNAINLDPKLLETVDSLPNFKSPHGDIIDSFHMANLLRCELCYIATGKFPTKNVPNVKYMTESIVKKAKKVKSLPTIEHGFLELGTYKRKTQLAKEFNDRKEIKV